MLMIILYGTGRVNILSQFGSFIIKNENVVFDFFALFFFCPVYGAKRKGQKGVGVIPNTNSLRAILCNYSLILLS